VRAMAEEGIPVIGHVGLIPYRSTWSGGLKAVGKTTGEALEVVHSHVESGKRDDMGNAAAHLPCPDDTDFLDGHGLRIPR